jgi:transposase
MAHKRGTNRSQSVLFPKVVDEYISAENAVRFIEAYVESLDVAQLGFRRAKSAKTGRRPYHPKDLLKLYIYGYLNRIRSSRQLEKATQRNVELMWLLRQLTPDFKTIADFRKENIEALKKVCREFTLLCKKMELFDGELVAIDGSKFSAVNHTGRVYTRARLRKLFAEIDGQIGSYFEMLESADEAEKHAMKLSTEELQKKIAHLEEQKASLRRIEQELEETGETQWAVTDAESRLMRMGNGGSDASYNVQIAVDGKHKLILAAVVTNQGNDMNQLSSMALTAKEVLSVERLQVVADAGYYKAEEVKRCAEEGIACYVPEPQKSHNKAIGLYTEKDFTYTPEPDEYRCPGGKALTLRGVYTKGGREMKTYVGVACRSCALRKLCTKSTKEPRHIYRWVHEAVLDDLRQRMRLHPEMMQRRKELAEHPFGTIKHWMGQGFFLMRGMNKVSAEISLSVLAYNLKRVMSIMGVPKLLDQLRQSIPTLADPLAVRVSFLARLYLNPSGG